MINNVQEVHTNFVEAVTAPPEQYTGDRDFDSILQQCRNILRVKGHDYVGSSPDRLANFNSAAKVLGQTPESVLGVYLWKHLNAIFTYLQKGQLESESIEGRIVDSINYLLLLSKMVAEKKHNTHP